jgi:dipeptidyl-peptidase-4
MNRFYIVLLFFCIQILQAHAQQKSFTPEDASFNNPSLHARGLSNLGWIPGTDFFCYQQNNALIRQHAISGNTDTLIRYSDWNLTLVRHNLKAGKSLPAFRWINESEVRFIQNSRMFLYNPAADKLSEINKYPEDAKNTDVAGLTNHVAYTLGNNLFIADQGEQIAVSDEPDPAILYGSERVHRNEFGISKGTFWSPDGKSLAFYRMDERQVTDYPLVDITTRPASIKNTKYPMAGMTIHQVQIGVFHTETGKTTYLQTDLDEEHYLTNVTWSPDSKIIYIAILNRDQNHLWLNCYDAHTGLFKSTLFEETNPRYVEPENGPWFVPELPNQFIWQSERDGYNHLYLYNTNGKLIRQITKGAWTVIQITGYNPATKELIFTATKDSPLEINIYTTDIQTGSIRRINKEYGVHTATADPDGRFVLDSYSNPVTPRNINIYSLNGKNSRLVHESPNPLSEYKLGDTKIVELKSEDNIQLYGRMITPPNFDPKKKYPVIIYVYGGPHSQLINQSWLNGASIYMNYLAQKDYIVFTLDNRGTTNRGFEFESIIHRNLGHYEVADQMQGVKYIKSLPFVDSARIGIDGWSYGGFMSINMLLENPGGFKAAVAGGPVCDWKYYEAMYGERYMDTPAQNPEGYKQSSLIEKAGSLNDKLLIIHCTTDPVVVWQHSIDFVQKCIEHGKLIEYFLYPGHEHNVRGKDRSHLVSKIEDFFRRNL